MKPSERDKLALEIMPHVERIIADEKRKIGITDPTTADELRSFAMEGLAAALDRFDPRRNVKFMHFAGPRIRGAIYDGLSEGGWLPRRLYRKISYLTKLEHIISSYADDPPPRDTVETVHRLADTLKDMATAYVTTFAGEEEAMGAGGHTPPEAPELVERRQVREILLSHLSQLSPRQYRIVFDYYFRDSTIPEIAEQLGISKGWVSKLLRAALRELRERMDEAGDVIQV